jgi:hypothetical protein
MPPIARPRSRRRNRRDPESGFSPGTPVISRRTLEGIVDGFQPRNPSFAGLSYDTRDLTFCLPCRRSRVRIPSAASENLRFAGIFRCGSRLVPLHPVGLIPDSRSADRRRLQGKRPVCRPISFVQTEVILQACRRSGVRLLRPLRRLVLQGTIQRTAPAGAIPTVAVLGGQSGFSPETARRTSARSAATPSEPCHPEP